MTQEFSGPALVGLSRAYGIAGERGGQSTALDDENISQVLAVQDVARRGLAPVVPTGLFYGQLANVHSVAGELESFFDPYNPVNSVAAYPAPIDPREFDIWLLGVSMNTDPGDGAAVASAMFGYDQQGGTQMISAAATGGPVTGIDRTQGLAGWSDFTTFAYVSPGDVGADLAGAIWMPMRYRVPPDTGSFTFRSEVSAAATTRCLVNFGIFPASLGQDYSV